jgi:hypothetical protein
MRIGTSVAANARVATPDAAPGCGQRAGFVKLRLVAVPVVKSADLIDDEIARERRDRSIERDFDTVERRCRGWR